MNGYTVFPDENTPKNGLLQELVHYFQVPTLGALEYRKVRRYLKFYRPLVTPAELQVMEANVAYLGWPPLSVGWEGLYRDQLFQWERLIEKYKSVLVAMGYSSHTRKGYISALRLVQKTLWVNRGISLESADAEQIRWCVDRFKSDKVSLSTIRARLFAVKHFFEQVIGRPLDPDILRGIRQQSQPPRVLTRNEVEKLIGAPAAARDRLILALIYAGGLRVSEVVALAVSDIDLENLTIKAGKGEYHRLTVFSERLREVFTEQIYGKADTEWLFPGGGKKRAGHLSIRSVQKIFSRALRRAGVDKAVTPQNLRHSFAAHLLENGIDLRLIQKLLGHKSIASTKIYTRVASSRSRSVRSPLL